MKKLNRLDWLNDRFEHCRCAPQVLTSAKKIKPLVSKLVKSAKLDVVKFAAHQFNRGYTAVWLFKQSHLSLHSWPEYRFLTVSIEVCSFDGDDPSKLTKLHQGLISLFKPRHTSPRKFTKKAHA